MVRHTSSAFRYAVVLAVALLAATASPIDYNRRVPVRVCTYHSDTSACFDVGGNQTYVVDKDVAYLSQAYRFCLGITKSQVVDKKIRVILVLDASRSMCGEPPGCEGSMKNDTANKRIDAAHLFVENLRSEYAASEVGVVYYEGREPDEVDIAIPDSQVVGPVSLDSEANVELLHKTIDKAACQPYTGNWSMEKSRSTQATAVTITGHAVNEALELVDKNYDPRQDSLDRHIIILTDGDWVGPLPEQLISSYRSSHPDLSLPVVHGIFLSDQARHLRFGHPASGLTTSACNPKDSVDLSYLQTITDSTGGKYFPGSTPENIASQFSDLLNYITEVKRQELKSISFANTATGAHHTGTFQRLPYTENDYLVEVPRMELLFDTNRIVITRTIADPDSGSLERIDTLTIVRSTTSQTSTEGQFSVVCGADTIGLAIERAPRAVLLDSAIEVTASVAAKDTNRFAPGSITTRLFVPFPDGGDGTLAVYHLERNLTDAHGVRDGQGAPAFSSTDAAFGSSVSSGSFTIDLPKLSSDFTIEAWIKPGDQAGTIMKGKGFELGVDESGRLSFTAGDLTLTSTFRIDTGVWEHVAASRKGGKLTLYVNGLPVSSSVDFSGELSDTATVGPLSGGYIDEIRISNVSRTHSVEGVTLLTIPTLRKTDWNIGGNRGTDETATLPSTIWLTSPRGYVDFSFSSSTPTYAVVNLFHQSPANMMWSKNSDGVIIYKQGLALTPEGYLVNKEGIPVNPAGVPISGVPVVAAMFDDDGDGHLDRVDITYPSKITLVSKLPSAEELIRSLKIVNAAGDELALQPNAVKAVDSVTLRLTLAENTGKALETGWKTADLRFSGVAMTETGAPFTTSAIHDSAGPVVSTVVAYPGGSSAAGDTLKVTLSEPVSCDELTRVTPDEVFVYYDAGKKSDEALKGSVFDESCRENYVRVVRVVVKNTSFDITPFADSLALVDQTPHARDQSGNVPPVDGRKSVIEWGVGNRVSSAASPNPFIPGRTRIADKTRQYYSRAVGRNRYGTVIGMRALIPLEQQADGSYGTAKVFDALANLVAGDLPVRETDAYGEYGVYWDGRNENGRYVGGGTYLIVIRTSDIDGGKSVERRKVAVKRIP